MNPNKHKIKIIPFKDEHTKIFKHLNIEWLQRFGLFEPADLRVLDNPRQIITEHGGKILIATLDNKVVGTCAIIKENEYTAELAKLAVSPGIQGKGIGRLLAVESINTAQKMGFKKLFLVSNKKLAVAVQLYESLGFKHLPVPENTIYETADVYMEYVII